MEKRDVKKSFSEGGCHQSRVDAPSLWLLALCLSEMHANSLRPKDSIRKIRTALTVLRYSCLGPHKDK